MTKWLVAAALIWLAWRVFAKPAPKKSEADRARALLGCGRTPTRARSAPRIAD
ncbi:hypothetical protein AB5I41_19605 [Sphingomonas sp. MMS24-JH45]